MEKKIESQSPYSNFDRLLINGQWRHGKGAKVLNDLNPYNGNILAEIPHANRDDMDEAYRGAAKAQHEWAALLPGGQRLCAARRRSWKHGAKKLCHGSFMNPVARALKPIWNGMPCMACCSRQPRCLIWWKVGFCPPIFPARKAACTVNPSALSG